MDSKLSRYSRTHSAWSVRYQTCRNMCLGFKIGTASGPTRGSCACTFSLDCLSFRHALQAEAVEQEWWWRHHLFAGFGLAAKAEQIRRE